MVISHGISEVIHHLLGALSPCCGGHAPPCHVLKWSRAEAPQRPCHPCLAFPYFIPGARGKLTGAKPQPCPCCASHPLAGEVGASLLAVGKTSKSRSGKVLSREEQVKAWWHVGAGCRRCWVSPVVSIPAAAELVPVLCSCRTVVGKEFGVGLGCALPLGKRRARF